MTTPESDFDAAKAVADLLKGMDKERQQRILRWVAESLSLDFPAAPSPDWQTRGGNAENKDQAQHSAHGQVHHRQGPSSDIKSFVDSKQPKSDVQFAAVVAYFYRFEASVENRHNSINATILQEAARLAGRRRPPSALKALNNAKGLGYLDSAERGQFQINSVGENLVAMTLPGSDSEKPRRKSSSKKSSKTQKR